MSAAVLIPARYDSQRFPAKPLAPILGRPMIQWVYERACHINWNTYVVTDHPLIEKVVKAFGGQVLRVDDLLESGTERVALAAQRFLSPEVEVILNLQGDEPLIEAQTLEKLIEFHKKNSFPLTTMVRERSIHDKDWDNPNVVKVVLSEAKQCLYFSRASVPFDRTGGTAKIWWQHIGLYAFSRKSLGAFVSLAPSPLEKLEKLEQLRALEAGWTIGACEVKQRLIGVDTPEDIARVEGVLSEQA
jgi:3-deoxy-manno-octulosonate cytidylyltransferase (CMP-KDO synthetase)